MIKLKIVLQNNMSFRHFATFSPWATCSSLRFLKVLTSSNVSPFLGSITPCPGLSPMAPLPVRSEWYHQSLLLPFWTRPFSFACLTSSPIPIGFSSPDSNTTPAVASWVDPLFSLPPSPHVSPDRFRVRSRPPLIYPLALPFLCPPAFPLLRPVTCPPQNFPPPPNFTVRFFALVPAPLDPWPSLIAFARTSTPQGSNAGSYSESKFSISHNFGWLVMLRVVALLVPAHLFISSSFFTGHQLLFWNPVFQLNRFLSLELF